MVIYGYWDRQGADRAEVPLRSLQPQTVQLLVLEFGRTLLACLLVLLAIGPLTVHAAVLDEAAGRAVLQLDGADPSLAAVGTSFVATIAIIRHAVHCAGVASTERRPGV